MFLTAELPYPAEDVARVLGRPARWLPGVRGDPGADGRVLAGQLPGAGRGREVRYVVTFPEAGVIRVGIQSLHDPLDDVTAELTLVPTSADACDLDLSARTWTSSSPMRHPIRRMRSRLVATRFFDAVLARLTTAL